MKGKTLIIAGITAAVLIVCFVVYNTHSNKEVESEQIAVVFPMDKMVSVEMFEETINDLYKETLVKSETAEKESDIQEIAEADEMISDAENEETLSKAESAQNTSEAQKSDPDGTTNLTDATKPSGDDTTTQPSDDGNGGGNGLTPEQQAFLDSLGGGPYTGPNSSLTGESGNGTGNHGITMAQ